MLEFQKLSIEFQKACREKNFLRSIEECSKDLIFGLITTVSKGRRKKNISKKVIIKTLLTSSVPEAFENLQSYRTFKQCIEINKRSFEGKFLQTQSEQALKLLLHILFTYFLLEDFFLQESRFAGCLEKRIQGLKSLKSYKIIKKNSFLFQFYSNRLKFKHNSWKCEINRNIFFQIIDKKLLA